MEEKLIKQSSSFCHYLLLILFVIGIHSCEFESDEVNYVQKEKPKDQIQLGIDLAGVNPTELIYVYNNSSFLYSLYTDEKEIFVIQFFLDGDPIATNLDTGEAYINTNITDNEIHELVLLIALKTGSSSLAEHAKYEMYTGEFKFKIKIIPYSTNLNIRQTTDTNNNLKLEWDKPLNYEIASYSVYTQDMMNGKLLAKINNPNETFFIDTEYAYGHKNYKIVAEIKNSFNLTVEDNIWASYEIITENNFEASRISVNEFSVKWNNPNPFPCKYVMIGDLNNEKKIIKYGVNETVISANDFPGWTESFNLYIIPKSADIESYNSYHPVFGSFRDKSFSAISFNVNVMNNTFHALNFESVNNYDISTMKQISAISHNLNLHTGCILKVTKDGKVGISDSQDYLHVFSDYSLKHEINKFKITSYPFHIISNNKILIQEEGGFKIYDIATKNPITSKLWKSEFIGEDIEIKISISADGKYFYILCMEYQWSNTNNQWEKKQWTELYEYGTDNTLVLLKKTNTVNIESILFHPIKNTIAIFQYPSYNENRFIIFDILTKNEKEMKGEFVNIDPFTGNLLYKGEEYQNDEFNLYVLDKDYANEKIKIKHANINSGSALLNNHLFFGRSYVNLHNLKEWKQ